MTIPQSFLDGDNLAADLLPVITKAEKKTKVVAQFWAGLMGRQLGYMATALGREDSLLLMDVLRQQIDLSMTNLNAKHRRKIKASLTLVKSAPPVNDDQE